MVELSLYLEMLKKSLMAEKVIKKCSKERWGLVYVHYIHKEIEEFLNTRYLSRLEKPSKNLPFLYPKMIRSDTHKMRTKQSKMMEDKEIQKLEEVN